MAEQKCKSPYFNLRLPPEQKTFLKREAKARGLSLGDLLRLSAIERVTGEKKGIPTNA